MTEFTEQTHKTPASVAAHLISDIFSPLLMPTYVMLTAMWLTRLHYLPLGIRIWATAGITVICAIIPLVVIAMLMRRGKVSDMSISNPRQRTVPYCTAIICYLGAVVYLYVLNAPVWLSIFFVAASIASIISLVITRWWKISAHTGGTGGLAAFIFWLGIDGYIEHAPLVWISAAVLLVGLMVWARLYLRHHTLAQTAAGAALSATIVYSLLYFFA